MATVTQRPDNLSLLRNLKSYKINTSAAITFKLLKGNDTVIEETYHPDGTNVVTIDSCHLHHSGGWRYHS